MRKTVMLASLTGMLLLAASQGFAAPPAASRNGTIVLVFKDGHRQTFSLADIDRVEFPASALTAGDTSSPLTPPRGHFIGKWEVGDGNGDNFFITLKDNGEAWRTLREVGGRWDYINGEARITWNDGAQDAIRKVGSNYQKFAYHKGKNFTDPPDNVTNAVPTNKRPI